MTCICGLCFREANREAGSLFAQGGSGPIQQDPEGNSSIKLFVCAECSQAIVEAHFARTGDVAMSIPAGEASQLERLKRDSA